MSKYAKWIGGGLGWAVGGPIGAIAGFVLGSLFDNASEVDMYNGKARQDPFQRQRTQTRSGDFTISLLILSAAIMKADGRVMKSELNYVKSFLVKQFGDDKALELVRTLREILDHDVSVRQVSLQIRQNMSHSMRLQLLHYLFGIAYADGKVEQEEFKLLRTISHYLGISDKDFYSISAMFGGAKSSIEDAYKILEIEKNASDNEIKKAYRKMAVKYHPDKVNSLGKDFQQAAKEKFQKVQEAYEQIKKERGMR
ncbi:TerB family tellurite resistance protein [Salibacter sp.]|uniref:TerB family tellurite resistance protein n=1 Tax=Salibacter sp. TaxID=2010995 RepID=UPI0028703414|nr:TerB family tellurite resistance protein [Salibacter sp.]MDR9399206.1 TerB family tellurite resistance protein [Salibacter sp.]MDR9487933.1 TerB family tellurite resistance protein [Salibacter sp.]